MVLRSLVTQLSPRALGRWICVLPVAVKNFLQPAPRPGSPTLSLSLSLSLSLTLTLTLTLTWMVRGKVRGLARTQL